MLSVVLGMAFSNGVVLNKRNFRWAAWIVCATVLIMMDPLRHVVYDAQYNPAACGPPGRLMSRETFYRLNLPCRGGQIVGNVMIMATMFRSSIMGLLDSWQGNPKFT